MSEHAGAHYGLGIDTGGTYTDAVIVDLRTNSVLAKAKARTTHDDLSIGLEQTIDKVLAEFGERSFDPALIGVSTTLATNTLLEGRGGRVGLIGLGWTPEPGWDLGAKLQKFIAGGHDVRGKALAMLDMNELENIVLEMAPRVDSIAVSGLFSVHNPYQEKQIKELIEKKHNLPVVAGHELTAELGIYERTTTAVLNARLIPVLRDFLDKVLSILQERGMKAPVMVFKGDGTLMNMRTARERPVDTILSGPAASAMGGRTLSGLADCIVIDIGGTSTDIAILEEGLPRVTKEGATVGRWRTRVEAVDMWTAAVGGDSEIRAAPEGGLLIGPQRVVPLCFATARFPDLAARMARVRQARFIYAVNGAVGLAPTEERIMSYLRENGPATLDELKRDLGVVLLDSILQDMRSRGAIMRIGLTPTDVLHAAGTYSEGDVEAARLGVEIFAAVLKMSSSQMIDSALSTVTAQISEELMKKVLTQELGPLPDSAVFQSVMDLISGKQCCPVVQLNASLPSPRGRPGRSGTCLHQSVGGAHGRKGRHPAAPRGWQCRRRDLRVHLRARGRLRLPAGPRICGPLCLLLADILRDGAGRGGAGQGSGRRAGDGKGQAGGGSGPSSGAVDEGGAGRHP